MKKLLLITLTLVLVSGLILAGCGEEEPAKTTTAAPATTTAAPAKTTTAAPATTTAAPAKTTTAAPATTTAAPTLQPKYGGTLIWMEGPAGVDTAGGWPWELWGPQSRSSQLVIEPLLRGDGKGGVQPWLAESYQLADDHLSITFTLRQDVRFHDGTAFDAAAAKWNLDNAIEAKSNVYWKSVDVIGDYVVRVNFTQWVNTLWGSFADGVASWMISPTAYNEHGEDWMRNNPTGTGPFKFVSFERDVSYKTVRNTDYWVKDAQGNQLPYLEAFNINYVTDVMTQMAVMKAGEADITANPGEKTTSEYVAAGFKTVGQSDTTLCFFTDDANADSPYSIKAVREAVEYAINKEAMAEAFSYGFWEAPYQILGPASPGYDPNYTGARKYDPDKARELLESAGKSGGFKTTLLSCTIFGATDALAYVQSDLAKVGIEAEIVMENNPGKFNEDSNVIVSMLAVQPVVAGSGNPNGALSFWFTTTPTSQMKNRLITPEYIELYNKSLTSPELDISLVRDAYNYMQSNATIIPFVGGMAIWVYAPYVMNGGWCERGSYINIKAEQIWLDK
jgi:ABC-type transport system substrate-binding protein